MSERVVVLFVYRTILETEIIAYSWNDIVFALGLWLQSFYTSLNPMLSKLGKALSFSNGSSTWWGDCTTYGVSISMTSGKDLGCGCTLDLNLCQEVFSGSRLGGQTGKYLW